jgi:hypothetical protein
VSEECRQGRRGGKGHAATIGRGPRGVKPLAVGVTATAGVASCAWRGKLKDHMAERDESPEALAHALVHRIFELLHECRDDPA